MIFCPSTGLVYLAHENPHEKGQWLDVVTLKIKLLYSPAVMSILHVESRILSANDSAENPPN